MKITRLFSGAALLAVFLVLGGCAHPISMSPDLAAVKGQPPLIDKAVGYYVSDASKVMEVTTPGGGGDKVRYFPYRDLEAGLYKALGETFKSVTKIPGPRDTAAMRAANVQLLIVPEITTNSSSPSPFTWPPTVFTITLSCTIIDAQGQTIKTLSVQGEGKAEFEEFKGNFSLSAVRASNDVLSKLVQALAQAPELRK